MRGEPKINQVYLVFTEKWNHENFGIDYSKPTWDDPVLRTETQMRAERALYERFGDLGIGSANPSPNPHLNAYGHRFMGALFGCEIVYLKDQAPSAMPLQGGYEIMEKFTAPDLDNSPVIERAWNEAEIFKKEYGWCSGSINTGSLLNNAVTIFGDMFLAAAGEEPELAQHILRVIMETQFEIYFKLQHKLEPEVYRISPVSGGYGNCPAVMISPDMYRKVILPVDKEYRARCGTFSLHHCGAFDRYAELYKELAPDHLDIGSDSDYAYMRKIYPDTTVSLLIDPARIEGADRAYIDSHISGMAEKAAPYPLITGLWTADFSPGMTDENIRDLATVHLRI
jgi:hypothetical protein